MQEEIKLAGDSGAEREKREERIERRGGARAGAGRPSKPDRVCMIASKVSQPAKERLRAYAAAHGISMAEALNRVLESL